MVPNQENMEGDQPVQSHSHTQQPLQPQTCVQEHCPGETVLNQLFWVSLKCLWYYFSKSWITYPVWVYVDGNSIECSSVSAERLNLMHAKFHCCMALNACQVSLLWHNSFLVSLWFFQPTLIHHTHLKKWYGPWVSAPCNLKKQHSSNTLVLVAKVLLAFSLQMFE